MLFPTPNQQCQSTERKCSWLTYANDDDVVASWQPKCSDGKRVGTEAGPTLWPPDRAATFGLETRLYRTRPRLVWSGDCNIAAQVSAIQFASNNVCLQLHDKCCLLWHCLAILSRTSPWSTSASGHAMYYAVFRRACSDVSR